MLRRCRLHLSPLRQATTFTITYLRAIGNASVATQRISIVPIRASRVGGTGRDGTGSGNVITDLGVRHSPPVASLTQAVHFGKPQVGDLGSRLLSGVQPKTAQEAGQPDEPGAGRRESGGSSPSQARTGNSRQMKAPTRPTRDAARREFPEVRIGPRKHGVRRAPAAPNVRPRDHLHR